MDSYSYYVVYLVKVTILDILKIDSSEVEYVLYSVLVSICSKY